MSRPSSKKVLWLVAGALVTAVTGAEGCRTPTEVTIDLRTVGILSCQDLNGIDIVVAASAREAEDRIGLGVLSTTVPAGACDADGHGIGTLVVIPSGGGGAIFVRARIKNAPDSTCTSPAYKGCIVARRAFSFIEHASVTLPIGLEAACEDVPCDVVTSCRAGTCVDATAVCSESSGTCSSPADPVLAPDGGSISPDDAGSGDASSQDGATDASTDAASDADAARDASVDAGGTGTNNCPVSGVSIDCKVALGAQAVCCGGASWQCETSAATCVATPKLDCTGALHCSAGMWCCGVPQSQSSLCASTCVAMGAFLCSTTADCPPGLTCSGSGPVAGGVTLATCH